MSCLTAIINKVRNYFYPPEFSDQKVDPQVMIKKDLHDWQVNLYTENPYLVKIPQYRIDEKRQELINKYLPKN